MYQDFHTVLPNFAYTLLEKRPFRVQKFTVLVEISASTAEISAVLADFSAKGGDFQASYLKRFRSPFLYLQTMLSDALLQHIEREFPHAFTPLQHEAAEALSRFVMSGARRPAFLLRGYAGTGKTSLVAALVRTLRAIGRPVCLLAPTGRAAKVFSHFAGAKATTIHRTIYRQRTFNGEDTGFDLGFNKLKDAVFIVDEASMLSIGVELNSPFGTGHLLDDLVSYVYQGTGCRLLLVGDRAQLPPVGEEESPALCADVMSAYGLTVSEANLTEVVRQDEASPVLLAATQLRLAMHTEPDTPPRIASGGPRNQLQFLPGNELIEALVSAYSHNGADETIVVVPSNKRAIVYNNGIRARIFDREDELTRGDRVMAVRNNYYWPEQVRKGLSREEAERIPFDFIANGDTAEVVRIRNIHEQHGFRFADAILRFPDYDEFEMECRVMLNTLTSEAPALTQEESRRLYENVLLDYADIPSRRERMKRLREDPYYNAVQLKYAYAVTCHKAQGGQWTSVFVDQGHLGIEPTGLSYLRWLYTAMTRTTDRLYLVNWPETQRANS